MTEIDLKDVAILVDFDGTITKKDTNDLLVEKYLNNRIAEISSREEDLKFMEFFTMLFNEMKITEGEYLEFILSEVELADGFHEFYKKVSLHNIPMAVLSGGFQNGIVPFLNKYGIEDLDVYANKLDFNGKDIKIEYYHDLENCCDIGSCGNCKVLHYQRYKKHKDKVIFIGDGITDRSVASKADMVFAKDGLLDYCNKHNIACIAWNDFDDISKMIFG